MRKRVAAGLVVFSLLIGVWLGIKSRDAVASAREDVSAQHTILSGTLGCIYSVDSLSMRFLQQHDVGILMGAYRMLSRCEKLFDDLGKSVQDKDTRFTLGEAKFFYDSYKQTMTEILARQVKLDTVYFALGGMTDLREAEKLEAQQQQQVRESQQFVNRLNKLLLRVW